MKLNLPSKIKKNFSFFPLIFFQTYNMNMEQMTEWNEFKKQLTRECVWEGVCGKRGGWGGV